MPIATRRQAHGRSRSQRLTAPAVEVPSDEATMQTNGDDIVMDQQVDGDDDQVVDDDDDEEEDDAEGGLTHATPLLQTVQLTSKHRTRSRAIPTSWTQGDIFSSFMDRQHSEARKWRCGSPVT